MNVLRAHLNQDINAWRRRKQLRSNNQRQNDDVAGQPDLMRSALALTSVAGYPRRLRANSLSLQQKLGRRSRVLNTIVRNVDTKIYYSEQHAAMLDYIEPEPEQESQCPSDSEQVLSPSRSDNKLGERASRATSARSARSGVQTAPLTSGNHKSPRSRRKSQSPLALENSSAMFLARKELERLEALKGPCSHTCLRVLFSRPFFRPWHDVHVHWCSAQPTGRQPRAGALNVHPSTMHAAPRRLKIAVHNRTSRFRIPILGAPLVCYWRLRPDSCHCVSRLRHVLLCAFRRLLVHSRRCPCVQQPLTRTAWPLCWAQPLTTQQQTHTIADA
jgi:hypothetical protein